MRASSLVEEPIEESADQFDPHYLIWLAGFFDGEGCVSFVDSNGYKQAHIYLTQKDRTPLDALAEYFGSGTVHKRRNSTGGCHQYVLTKQEDVLRFLNLISPHLRLKQEKALEAIDHVTGQLAKRGLV